MEFLKIHRYRVLPLEELVRLIRSGGALPPNAVAITFDDGNLDNFNNAFPVLKRMNFPATIFMITANIGKKDSLSEEDLKILDESGVTIGSHTVHHAFLPKLKREDALLELEKSKETLEKILERPVTMFSYPAGGLTAETLALVARAGYLGAVTTNYGRGRHDPLALHRIKVSEAGGNLFDFWAKTSGFYHLGKRRIEAV
jgi:peptidoglycan/xylan/chitin deacetylase (PgdA/CDA1 family)